MMIFSKNVMCATPAMKRYSASETISATTVPYGCAKRNMMGIMVMAAAMLAQLWPQPMHAAELTIEDGVVVKFGADAQLVVRDRLVPGKGVVLTSQKDDSIAGQSASTAQTPAPGDWRGVRLEKSMTGTSGLVLADWWLRYAGVPDAQKPGAALAMRGISPQLQYVQITDSIVGLALVNGAAPAVSGSSFLRNVTGVQSENASPNFSSTQFVGNSAQAIENKTPAISITALGNWWGHVSGPKDSIGNPQGQGDAVSAGVNYANYLASAPLLNPTVRLAVPALFYEQRTVLLDLSCVNATEYRLAEGNAFAGVPFQALQNGRAQTNFTTSQGDGRKTVNVQFRNADGTVATAALSAGVLIDTQVPSLSLINPASGSLISQPITLEASASDGSGITKLEFYLDGTFLSDKTSAPYTHYWNTDTITDGSHTIRVVATDGAGRTSEQSAQVTLSRTPVAPDTEGPSIVSPTFLGSALADGAVLSRNGVITFSATDRSGISRIDLLLNGAVVATATGAGGAYRASLNLDAIANGTYTLSLRASDSLGNVTTTSYAVTVAHAAPESPSIAQPVTGFVTRNASLPVSGSAKALSSVQIVRNGQPAGVAVQATNDGRFSATVELVPGQNQIQATATDAYGSSPLSAAVLVNLDVTVPASPGGLTAQALDLGKVRLTWTRSTDANAVEQHLYRAPNMFTAIAEAVRVATLSSSVISFEDLPPSDVSWTYRMVAVNAAGTPSLPTNAATAQSDATPPKAVSIAYASLGKVDAATGRYGQGRINLVLTTSEALQTTPYLSVVPQGGAPIPVELLKASDTVYNGNFLIDANTPSGLANVLFSARDLVGNRGTEVLIGATLRIDTEGPTLSSITLNPVAPIKNDSAQLVQATFGYSKAPTQTPQIKYLLSGPLRSAVVLGNLTRVNDTTYSASFNLPGDAGLGGSEILSFSQQAQDDLDNISSRVSAFNRHQVYQGNLPPLDAPFGFSAKAQAGGKVKLAWQAVLDANSYQIYRQVPGGTLQALTRTAGIEYIDQTPADGRYSYALATVRQANGQESLSAQTAAIEVLASATAPGAPQGLTLTLTGQGIYAAWQPPLSSTVDYYNLYRANGTVINSIEGLTPLKTRIQTPQTYDSAPSPTQGAYVVTALDAAGNESAISNSAYLNASLLPVRDVRIEQLGSDLPTLSWAAPNGNVSGYLVYVGPDASKSKLTPNPVTGTRITDTGFTAGERRYTIASVDANGVEMPRTVLLPNLSSQIVSGLPIKRGIMNKLQVQVSNASGLSVGDVRAVVRLPIDRDATQFKDHKSEPITLSPNQTLLVPVIVGGYADLPGAPAAQVGVEITNEGELVKIARNQTVNVTEGTLVVGMATDEFTRGGTGKLKLTIENTSEVDVELLTATNNGANESSELRFKLLDADNNILSTQAYKQVFGANVVTLTNGQTVARIPAGSAYVSDTFHLNVPSASPNSIRVRLEVDKLRYHSGQEDEVQIAGRGSERTVSLSDTAYLGEVTQVTPISSFGDQDIVINGRALDRASKAPLPNTRLKLILNQQGFERSFSVLTDASGEFAYTFKPTLTDAGLYKVSAVHPDITDRPEQKAFTINRVTVGPTPYRLDVPKNYPFTIPFTARAGVGTSATNLRLVLNAASQPTGQIPAGISVQLPAPVSLVERQTLNLPVQFTATNDAQPSGALIFDVQSDEHANTPLAQVRVDFSLSEAKPYLVSTPSLVETGLAQGGSQVESVTVKNNGLQDALNLHFVLTKADGTPAPAWASIGSAANGTLAIGQSRAIDLAFSPPAGTPEGVYEFKLTVTGENVPSQSLNVYVSLTQSGQGNVLFKTADIYTATIGKDGNLIPGLAGATITVQNEDVPTVSQELTTDALGEALFQGLPAGRYKFRAKASNHQEAGGRLIVKPGITANQSVFLDYNLITVEWSVREITIQDRYEITLNATFETDVPAAVVVIQPTSINLPKMAAGDVYYGELNLTNYGLIRADNVKQSVPQSDAYFRYEFLVDVPATLEAKQRITIPYRVIALQSLEGAANSGTASGGGCYNYSNSYAVSCNFQCANGTQSPCGASTSWFSVSNSSCPGGNGGVGGGGSSSDGGWPGGGFGGGGGSSTPIIMKGNKCVYIHRGGMQCPAPPPS